jgi:hypothetical protein
MIYPDSNHDLASGVGVETDVILHTVLSFKKVIRDGKF